MTNDKVKKIDLAEVLFKEVHLQGHEKPRAVFMKRAQKELELSKNCAASYYQMLKYEADGKGTRYKHHNKKKVEPIAEVIVEETATEEVATNDGKSWVAIKGEVVEYFGSRNAARKFNSENGGGFKIEKVA
jgi:hypothetical protein